MSEARIFNYLPDITDIIKLEKKFVLKMLF